jgi:hypothetical protein
MRENAEQRAAEEQLARIASELKQIKMVLVALVLVSPVGLYILTNFTDLIVGLGVIGFWITLVVAGGLVLLLSLSRLTGLHKTLALKQDELSRILKEHNSQHEDSTL